MPFSSLQLLFPKITYDAIKIMILYQPLPQLPDSLISLHLGSRYNLSFSQLPNSLQSLHLGWNYNQQLPTLPDSLQSLHLGYCYNQL